ncbi:hypothetical protein FJZ33_01965 [Candidatus Poribacteria bacterium]|nr:hypothetical protein [Candidatus Poribacteria bacterium]
MLRLTALMYAGIYISCNLAYGQVNSINDSEPWWEHSKIAIAYGDVGRENESIDGYKLLHLAGVTAIVGGIPSDDMIQSAAAESINLIGLGYAWGIPHAIPSCRNAVNEKGQISTTACPFSEPFWEVTIRQPVLRTAQYSLKYKNVVGFFVDSEQYAVYPNINVCYCDNCWEHFIEYKGLKLPEIDASERVKWLESHNPPLNSEYIEYVIERFTEQYGKLAEEVHTLNPLFVFGKLPEAPTYWYDIGMALGTATNKAPFFVLLEGTYACSPGYGSNPTRSGWEPGYEQLRLELDRLNIPYRVLGGIWLTINSKEKADKRYTRDVFQLYDQAYRLGSHPASNGYWFGPVGQIINRDYFRQHYPGSDIRDYWLALRSVNRLLGIPIPEDEKLALQFLRKIDD